MRLSQAVTTRMQYHNARQVLSKCRKLTSQRLTQVTSTTSHAFLSATPTRNQCISIIIHFSATCRYMLRRTCLQSASYPGAERLGMRLHVAHSKLCFLVPMPISHTYKSIMQDSVSRINFYGSKFCGSG